MNKLITYSYNAAIAVITVVFLYIVMNPVANNTITLIAEFVVTVLAVMGLNNLFIRKKD